MLTIETFNQHFFDLWESSDNNLPLFKRRYSEPEQISREQSFDEMTRKLEALKSHQQLKKIRKSQPENTFFPLLKSFMHDIFDFEEEQLEIIMSESFRNVSRDFFYQARAFGPELSPENIYQALRNVWIMNGLQLTMGLPVEITPSVFAYSMIYPYSDNFLDDQFVTAAEKHDFSERFNQRLHGDDVPATNSTEAQLFKLVAMIESQFDRQLYTDVYESLYAIQKAQTASVQLLGKNGLSQSETRRICFEKGATSVMADGFLVAGNLNAQQQQALYGYGIYLQLLDDIQDSKEDADSGTYTMCSGLAGAEMELFVNKTIHFGRTALKEMKCFDAANVEIFLQLMNRSIETMIVESVGLNTVSFTDAYLQQLEAYSPLRFEFVRERKSASKSQRFEIFRRYFDKAQPKMV